MRQLLIPHSSLCSLQQIALPERHAIKTSRLEPLGIQHAVPRTMTVIRKAAALSFIHAAIQLRLGPKAFPTALNLQQRIRSGASESPNGFFVERSHQHRGKLLPGAIEQPLFLLLSH